MDPMGSTIPEIYIKIKMCGYNMSYKYVIIKNISSFGAKETCATFVWCYFGALCWCPLLVQKRMSPGGGLPRTTEDLCWVGLYIQAIPMDMTKKHLPSGNMAQPYGPH